MRWLKKCPAYPFNFMNKETAFGISSPNWTPSNLVNYAVNNVYHEDKLLLGMRFNRPAVLQQFSTAMLGSLSEPKCGDGSDPQSMLRCHLTTYRGFSKFTRNGQSLTRDWFAQLWTEDKRKIKVRRGRIRRLPVPRVQDRGTVFDSFSSQLPFLNSFLRKPAHPEPHSLFNEETIRQPPVSHYDGDHLPPSSPEEVKLASLLSRDNLVITRDIEWANIMFAFEQESRYVILDPHYPNSPVGFIQEKSNVISRQLLRGRRPFVAYIFDAKGNEIFRVRRPFWWINSTIYVEVDGKEMGVVHSRWHLWRRIYDLYLGNKQFAVVENPGLWNWTFTLKDEDESVLAQIDRDWRGLGLEVFTDAGQYVIRFGDAGSYPKTAADSRIEDLAIARPLSLSERSVAVALAISLDNDYFSRRGGWGLPIIIAGE